MKKVRMILSYILVAALASMLTLHLYGGTTATEEGYDKLDHLANLIEAYFIVAKGIASCYALFVAGR